MNCLNGFFHDLYTESLAEALLKAPQGGAVAVWASSTLAEFTPQPAYNQEFLMNLSRTSLGETALQAKQSITDVEARRTWILFGDPTLFGKPQAAPSPDGGANDGPGASDAAMTIEAGASDTMAMDGATVPDADGSADAKFTSPPSNAGCGCALDGSSSRGPSGLALLMLAVVATIRRRDRRGRLGLLGLTLTLTSLAWAPSAQAAYGFRKALTIDRTRIGTAGGATTMTNYPLLINMTDAVLKNAGAGHVQSANGYDIAFTGADATTCGAMMSPCTFNYEIENTTARRARSSLGFRFLRSIRRRRARTRSSTSSTATRPSSRRRRMRTRPGTRASRASGTSARAPVTTQNDSTATAASATANGAPTPAVVASAEIGPGVSTSGTTGAGLPRLPIDDLQLDVGRHVHVFGLVQHD